MSNPILKIEFLQPFTYEGNNPLKVWMEQGGHRLDVTLAVFWLWSCWIQMTLDPQDADMVSLVDGIILVQGAESFTEDDCKEAINTIISGGIQ